MQEEALGKLFRKWRGCSEWKSFASSECLTSESLLCNPTLLFNWSSQGEQAGFARGWRNIPEVSLGGSHAVDYPSGAEELCRGETPLCWQYPSLAQSRCWGRDRRPRALFFFSLNLCWFGHSRSSLWHTGSFVFIVARGVFSWDIWTLSCGLWEGSSSLTKDQTQALCIGSVRS